MPDPVLQQLEEVQFYTSLDPYYYTVDNRPLQNLDNNIRTVAQTADDIAGDNERAAMACATSAYALLGYGALVEGDPIRQAQGMFSANYELSSLTVTLSHGYLVRPVSRGGSPEYIEPRLAVHDAVTAFTLLAGRGHTVQVTYRDSTTNDRVPSGTSTIQVAELSVKSSTEEGVFPAPDVNSIAIMHIDIPAGAASIQQTNVTLVNMKTINQTSDLTDSYTLVYEDTSENLSSGADTISLSGSGIDGSKIESVEVFVQGVNQFNWTYNAGANSITLAAPLTEAAEVRVRQANLLLV